MPESSEFLNPQFNLEQGGAKCDRHSTTTVPSAPALGTKRREREREAKGQTREIIVSLYYDSSSLTLRSVKVLNRAFCIIMPLSIVPVSLSLPLPLFILLPPCTRDSSQLCFQTEAATPCALSRGNNNCLRAYIYKMACPCPCKAALTPPRTPLFSTNRTGQHTVGR